MFIEKIDYHIEEILIPISEKFPEMLLSFFKSRIKYKSNINKYYEAIPFGFYSLPEHMTIHLDLIIDTVCNWYDKSDQLLFLEAQLVHNLFPRLPSELENKLINLVNTGDEKNISVVIAILRNYHNNPALYTICKEIVGHLTTDNKLLNEVPIILEYTGITSGEFGRVKALKLKKDEISNWLTDPNTKVSAFAKKYVQVLENQIKHEQRQAEESIELQKHRYGDANEKNRLFSAYCLGSL